MTTLASLPPELLAFIATRHLTSKLDQLAFLVSDARFFTAFCHHAKASTRGQFYDEFQLDAQAVEFSDLLGIYNGLQRIRQDPNALAKDNQHVRYFYSLERHRGYLDESDLRSSLCAKTTQQIRDQISNSTFAFDLSPDEEEGGKLVLIHSLNGKQSSTMTVWPSCRSFRLPFEVMGQDLLIMKDLVFIMPLAKRGKYYESTLLAYDMETGKERVNFKWSPDEGVKRRQPPIVFKESGEKRLYSYHQKLVQIFPSDVWTILVYEVYHHGEKEEGLLQLIHAVPLPWVEASVIGQLFCADQQGPHLLLGFFSDKQGLARYSGKVVALDMSASDDILKYVDDEDARKCKFDLSLPVDNIGLFLCATTEYVLEDDGSYRHHTTAKRHGRPSAAARTPVIIFLFPDGNLKNNLKHEDKALRRINYRIDHDLWHHNELVVKNDNVIVMHLIRQVGRLVYAANLRLEILWSLEVDALQSLDFLKEEQRLYLHASHGLVWLSSAKGCLLVNRETGEPWGNSINYPLYKRHLPELQSVSEDTSPYAQTGFSIWEIQCKRNGLFLVHDIERCAPVVFDQIQF